MCRTYAELCKREVLRCIEGTEGPFANQNLPMSKDRANGTPLVNPPEQESGGPVNATRFHAKLAFIARQNVGVPWRTLNRVNLSDGSPEDIADAPVIWHENLDNRKV